MPVSSLPPQYSMAPPPSNPMTDMVKSVLLKRMLQGQGAGMSPSPPGMMGGQGLQPTPAMYPPLLSGVRG